MFLVNISMVETHQFDMSIMPALTTGLENVATFVSDHAWYSTYHSFDNAIIGLPWIGCGLANGEKSVVLEI
jgi:hypothetical protein